MLRIAALTEEIRAELGMTFVARPYGQRCVLRDNRVSMNIGWRQAMYDSVSEDAEIIAAQFNGPLYVPDEPMMTVFMPNELRRSLFTPTLSLAREVRWIEVSRKAEPLSTEELAHRIVTLFLDLLDHANKGQIDFMHL
jgi:hypothetical protein